jgi:hypothetical protein
MKNKTSITNLTRLCVWCIVSGCLFLSANGQDFSTFNFGYNKSKQSDTIKIVLLVTMCDTCQCKAINAYAVRFKYYYSGDPMPPGDYSDQWRIDNFLDIKKKKFAKEVKIWNSAAK